CNGTINWVGTLNGGDGTQWTTAKNWDQNRLPISTDDVCIPPAFVGATIAVGSLSSTNQTINSLVTNADINFTIGPLTVVGAATFANNLTLAAGTLTLNGTSSVGGNFTQSGGTLTGSGAFSVTGVTAWSGGTMSGAGITNANGGITFASASVT